MIPLIINNMTLCKATSPTGMYELVTVCKDTDLYWTNKYLIYNHLEPFHIL